jgi:protein-tyrosine phosphatase
MSWQYNYADIHSHILPGIDDGSRSMEQTVRMLHMASAENITTIIATPHYIIGADNPPVEKLVKLAEQVQQEAVKINKDFKILLGNEIYCRDTFFKDAVIDALKSGKALTLAGSRYVLVEFAYSASFKSIRLCISNFIYHGYIPILAHIERYRNIYRNMSNIEELVKMGCCIQMNCRSVTGGYMRLKAPYNRKLINYGLVHLIASDCHDDVKRIPIMQKAVSYLESKCDKELLQEITIENTIKIIENKYI